MSANEKFLSSIFLTFILVSNELVFAAPNPELFPGWPKSFSYNDIGRNPTSSASVGNFDTMPDLEITAGFPYDSLYLWNYQANLLPGWPVLPKDSYVYWTRVAAIGDVDGDGENEIVTTREASTASEVHVFKKDGSELSGWPKNLNSYDLLEPVLADFNRDGRLEIVITPFYDTLAYVFDYMGNNYPGWPQRVPTFDNRDLITQSPAVGDLEGDGDLEIMVVTFLQVIAYNSDGSLVTGFPAIFPKDFISFTGLHSTLADLDNNGKLEILVSTWRDTGNFEVDGYLVVLDYQGQNYPGYPLYFDCPISSNVVAADLDNDNFKEIIFELYNCEIGKPNVYVIRYDGSLLAGWPAYQFGKFFSDPMIADIDGDNSPDIVLGDSFQREGKWGRLYAYNKDGFLIEGYPLQLLGFTSAYTPLASDVNKDDTLDMVVLTNYGTVSTSTYILRLFNMKVPYNPKTILWGKYLHDPYNTSNAEFIVSQYRGDPNGDEEINLEDIVYLVNFVFRGKTQPNPLWIGDLNCDGKVNLADIVYLVNLYFKNGPGPCKP